MLYLHENLVESNYSALYTGLAEMLTDNMGIRSQIIYNSQDIVFVLTKKEIETMCHFLVRTEHPKLLIFETTPHNKIFSKVYKPENLNIFIYTWKNIYAFK